MEKPTLERRRSVFTDSRAIAVDRRLTVIQGAATRIAEDTRNSPDSRGQARLIGREVDGVKELLFNLLEELRFRTDPE